MTPKKDTLDEWRALPAHLRSRVCGSLTSSAFMLRAEDSEEEALAMEIAAAILRDLGKPVKRGAK